MAAKNQVPREKASFSTPPAENILITTNSLGGSKASLAIFIFRPNPVKYLDPKTSRWLSADPAIGEYIPSAPVNDQARRRNGNLPGMGGVYNYVNLHMYHYAGNNPIRYLDPDGRISISPILRWLNRNKGELAGATLSFLELSAGLVASSASLGTSLVMTVHGGAGIGSNVLKMIITTYIANTSGDDAADIADKNIPSSPIGMLTYGLAHLIVTATGSNYRSEEFTVAMGSIGNIIDIGIGLGVGIKLSDSVRTALAQTTDPNNLERLRNILQFADTNLIAKIGKPTYEFLTTLLDINDSGNSLQEYYFD
jgi:hypothetical protein